jgi:hypothetical protein
MTAIAVTLALMAGSARADGSTIVRVVGCANSGGSVTVPAGDVTVRVGGYAVGTYGLAEDVLLAQTTTLQVGSTTYDLSNSWSAPIFVGPGFWLITQPNRDIGPLAAGQSVTVTYDIAFSHPVAILYPPVGSSGNNGPYIITEDGPATCTITAT